MNKFIWDQWAFCKKFNDDGYDALLTPGGCFSAMKHGYSKFLALGWCYTYMGNMCDFPSGAIPVTTVRKDEQYVDLDQWGNDDIARRLRENAEDSEGLPVGVQVCGLAMHDEKVLAAMKIVDDVVSKDKGFKIPLQKPNKLEV